MSYYFNNGKKILDKYHNLGGKEKAKEYYQNNKDILKEKARTRYQNLSEEQKEIKRKYSRNRYQELIGKLQIMSYYQDNKDEVLKRHMTDTIIGEVKKKQLNIIEKIQIY